MPIRTWLIVMPDNRFSSYLILFALWLMMFSASSQTMIMSPILPLVGDQLHIPQEYLGTLITSYSVMLGVFALITGPISDMIGRRRILLFGTGAMCITLFLHYYVYDFITLLLARALTGMAGGMLSGVAPSYIGDYFPSEKRGWANGMVMTGIAAGQILGIPFGTLLADWFTFSMPFVFFSLPMALSFLLVFLYVPQPQVVREKQSSIRTSVGRYIGMLRNTQTLAATGAYCMMFMGITFYVIYLVVWIEDTFGATGKEVASLFAVAGIASVIVGPWAGRLSDRIGRKIMIIGSCIGLFFLMAATTTVLTSFWMAYPLFFVIMVLVSARMGPFQALLSELVPDERRGSLMSLSIASGQLAMGLCSLLAGFVYTNMGYTVSSIIGAIGMLIMGIIVWLFIPETRSDRPEPIIKI